MKSSVQLLSSSTLSLFFVTLISLFTAYVLGPVEFGFFSACQAIAVIVMPLVCFRLETRVAVCKTDKELSELSIAVKTGIVIFLSISTLALLALSYFFNLNIGLMIVFLAAGIVLVDFELSRFAFLQMYTNLAIHRFFRQVLPVLMALIASFLVPQHQFLIGALLVGTWGYVFLLSYKKKNQQLWSFTIYKRIFLSHFSELKASFSLGVLNSIWLNGLQPLMVWMGLHQLAGQFALLQKIINAPLAVITVAVNTYLLEKGNLAHTQIKLVMKAFYGLVLISAAWIFCLWFFFYGGFNFNLPKDWIPNQEIFISASFFWASSFAVGAISLISIRLKDEWFMACWQLILIFIWALGLFVFDPERIFKYLLIMGGLAYIFLMWRWTWLINSKDEKNNSY